VHRIATPPALAVTLAMTEQARAPGAPLCLSVDGQDPGQATQAAAREAGLDSVPASACPEVGDVLRVDVADYRTDGSGAGTISLSVARGDATAAVQQLDVRREDDAWLVGDTL
jgi:hypothetical protein